MSEKNRIVVIADFESDAEKMVDRAIVVGKKFDCELEIVFCDAPNIGLFGSISLSTEADVLRKHIRTTHEEFVQSLANRAIESGLSAKGSVLDQRPISDAILAYVQEIQPLLVMKSAMFHSKAQRGILVDTDWQLMRSCPYPLWLVKKADMADPAVIVAAVDPLHEHDKPAELDEVIIRSATTVANRVGGEVELLHTYETLSGIGKLAGHAITPEKLPIDEIEARIKQEHSDALDSLAAKHNIDATKTHLLPGRPRDILPTFVRDKDVDLIVMGALARWSLKRMVIGSTAERVLDHLPCDVLVVRNNDNSIQV